MADRSSELQDSRRPGMVVTTFNCEGWNSVIMKHLLEDISENHSRTVILACQETWLYELPQQFKNEFSDRYHLFHEAAMTKSTERSAGRPFGGIAFIISKSVPFEIKYTHHRCFSILITHHNVLINNIYIPYNDRRISVEENIENVTEFFGHLDAAIEIANTSNIVTLGDFNVAPSDNDRRARLIKQRLVDLDFKDSDLQYLAPNEYSHNRSGRLIDRIVATSSIAGLITKVEIPKHFLSSDHFAVISELDLSFSLSSPSRQHIKLNWQKASPKAIEAYSSLAEKLCMQSLGKFKHGSINLSQLYKETVHNLEKAAFTCIPKYDPNKTPRRHNIPLWRERMAAFKHTTDYWVQQQFLHGGPARCGSFIKQQVLISKSRYRRQLRALRREIEVNVAETTTLQNCFKRVIKHSKPAPPAMIEGYSTSSQPAMWHDHLKGVYNAEDTPYCGTLLTRINSLISNDTETRQFDFIRLTEINNAISDIDTNKSYKRHFHWKNLQSKYHSAKLCLNEIINSWVCNVLQNENYFDWDFFLTNVSFIPKKDKKDLSLKKSFRPISIGTSENWILEKILLQRIYPYMKTSDFQFGYKAKHSTSHAIEIVRILEREHDAHVCLLDASSAFDLISWERIFDQLLKRNLPILLIKIIMTQLFSTKISVYGMPTFFPRAGVKQGGVLSGTIFSSCYDDLVKILKRIGSGVLLNCIDNKFTLLFILIYADDIVLIASSPNGLRNLIKETFYFAELFNDLHFNQSKSWILRLGPHRKPPVSVCQIPTTECAIYLGVEIGRGAQPERAIASKLYTNTNILLKQNRELRKCSNVVKNTCINCYGNVYSLENVLCTTSFMRNAHRYLTMSVHTNWRDFADLNGHNIRSRRLYSVFQLDSLEVIHRRRRNYFLLKASSHENSFISSVLG